MYVQSDTSLFADVFENVRNICIEIYELIPLIFLSAPGLAWQAFLKNTRVELELLTDINMLLMVKKAIRGGICHAIYRCANDKYKKNYDNNEDLSYLLYLDTNNLYGFGMSQKLAVNGFKWKKEYSKI